MYSSYLRRFAEDMIELIDDTVKIIDDIITAVVGVTGIKAHPQAVFFNDACLYALPHVGAEMKDKHFASHGRSSCKFYPEKIKRIFH